MDVVEGVDVVVEGVDVVVEGVMVAPVALDAFALFGADAGGGVGCELSPAAATLGDVEAEAAGAAGMQGTS